MSNRLNFYLTSNFGGGGQTVSRLFSYLSLLDGLKNSNIHLLLNYRYLDYLDIKPIFNSIELAYLKNNPISLNKYISYVGNKLAIQNGEISSQHSYIPESFTPDIFLDSGMGSILSFWINEKGYSINKVITESIKLIDDHLNFVQKHKPKYFVGLDYCKKNTYKKKETEQDNYNLIIDDLIHNSLHQNNLLEITIQKIQASQNNPKSDFNFNGIGLIAPIHGETISDYILHYKSLLNIESRNNFKFAGFALGGLAKFKASSSIGKIVKLIRELNEKRFIHILGSSGIDKLPILTLAGADSFDCHSPWRRANDGDSKILIPLLDNNLNFSNQSLNTLSFCDISKLTSKNYHCNCPICSAYSIDQINNLYNNRLNSIEDYYFSLILIYCHALYQYHYLQLKLETLKTYTDYITFFKSIPNAKLSNSLIKQAQLL
jgi:hypothetical protein